MFINVSCITAIHVVIMFDNDHRYNLPYLHFTWQECMRTHKHWHSTYGIPTIESELINSRPVPIFTFVAHTYMSSTRIHFILHLDWMYVSFVCSSPSADHNSQCVITYSLLMNFSNVSQSDHTIHSTSFRCGDPTDSNQRIHQFVVFGISLFLLFHFLLSVLLEYKCIRYV